MKILLIGNSTVGMYKFRKELISKFIELENEVTVVVPNDGYIEEIGRLGCKVRIVELERRGKNPLSEIKLLQKYRKVIKEENPDKLITYTIKPNIYCGIINRFYKKDFYPNITGLGTAFQNEGMGKKIISKLYKIAFKNVDKVFFENEVNRNVFLKEEICKKEKTVLLNGAGVNLEEFKFEPLPSFETINFIFMGRIMKEKGVEELFYAIREIKKKYKNTNFMILGQLEENYKAELEEMEREGLLKYYGVQKDVKKYIKMAHCCILPSHHEGMSNTLLECGAMGRALIASDIPGCRESIKANYNGFLHKVQDKVSLEKSIKEYLELGHREKKELGTNSKRYIKEKFDKRLVINKSIDEINGENENEKSIACITNE